MTTYQNPFTGQTISPSQVGYVQIALTSSTTLTWPINGNTGTVTANIIEVVASSPGLNLLMPSALQVSTGQSVIVRNIGSNSFTVTDASGNTIVSVTSGIAQYIYLTDNNTNNGTWSVIQYGAGTSQANAATLAGYGLYASGTTLNQAYTVNGVFSTQNIVSNQRAQLLVWSGGVGTLTLPGSSTVGNNWFVMVRNGGSGVLTVSPSGSDTIDGNASQQLQITNSCVFVSNGTTGFNTFGLGQSTQFAYTQLSLPITGGTVTLTSAQAANVIQNYTGTLTSNQIIVVPSTVQTYYVSNNTTGSYTLTFKTSGVGTQIAVPQSNNAIIVSDGLNVYITF